jgi:hypothetical protein
MPEPQVMYDGAVIADYGTVLRCPECKKRLSYQNHSFPTNLAVSTYMTIRAKCKCSTDWKFTYDLRNLKAREES